MKKATILLILLAMSFTSAFICIGPVGADHEAQITVEPVYYKGGGETKIFNVTNLDFEGADPIIEVVITFPEIHDGDVDYKPVDYQFPEDWKATYEPALRQVTFVSLYPDDDNINIQPGDFELFTIVFEEGPTEDGKYVWIVSTTDKEKIAHTYYPEQWIDTTAPFVRIDYPEDGTTVIATWDPYPDHHYLSISVTATDEVSGIGLVEVQVSNKTWTSKWVDITANRIDDTYYIDWYDLDPKGGRGLYNATARAFDNADNKATDRNEFEYWIIGVWIKLDPNEGTVWRETTIKDDVYRGGKFTYGDKTLGTEVEVTGGGFAKNSKVNVTVDHPLWGEILVVKNADTDEDGGFTASFLFPTAPQGIYAVNAIDLDGFEPLYPEWFTVVPEIIYKPAVVIGPAVIEVIATGFPRHGYVIGFMFDGTDALIGMNDQVWNWGTDENGTLRSWSFWCPEEEESFGKPGFVMPVLEPETYEVAIGIQGRYWDGTIPYWPYQCTLVSNTIEVVVEFKELMDAIDKLGLKLDDIKARIVDIKDEVATIETTVGRIEAKLLELEPIIVDIQGRVITIGTTVGEIKGEVVKIEDDVAYMRPIVDDIKDDTGDIKITTDLLDEITPEDFKDKLDAIYDTVVPTPTATYLPITAVLAAIAAIASCIAAAVVLRRLRVAG